MSDLVKRLRDPNRKGQEPIREEAADRIERLEEALHQIIAHHIIINARSFRPESASNTIRIARTALQDDKP